MESVPNQYKPKIDKLICDIGDAINELRPYIMELGERVFTLLKAYTTRQGLTRKDDRWADRFYQEPMSEGPAKGAVLSRETMDKLLDEYYELRDWDKSSGLPTAEKLTELGLSDVANELIQMGRIPAGETTS